MKRVYVPSAIPPKEYAPLEFVEFVRFAEEFCRVSVIEESGELVEELETMPVRVTFTWAAGVLVWFA